MLRNLKLAFWIIKNFQGCSLTKIKEKLKILDVFTSAEQSGIIFKPMDTNQILQIHCLEALITWINVQIAFTKSLLHTLHLVTVKKTFQKCVLTRVLRMKRRQNMFNASSTRLIFRYQLSSILARHSSPSQQIRRMSPIRFKFLGRHRKQEPDMPSGLNIFLGFFGLLCLFLAEQNKTSVSTAKGLAQFVISTKLPHSTFVTVPGKIRCNGWNPAISKKKKPFSKHQIKFKNKNHVYSVEICQEAKELLRNT